MKFRRHAPQAPNWAAWRAAMAGQARRLREVLGRGRRRSVLLWSGAFAAAFVVGYLVAALVLFPAPFFAGTISVPRLLGMSRAEATETLNNAGLASGQVVTMRHPTAPAGDVVWQDPPPGVGVGEGTPIGLTLSAGPQQIPVPDLAGYEADFAARLAQAAGLRVRRIQTEAPVPEGVLVNTRPPAGRPLVPGDTITMVVSRGAPTITVPDLTGFTPEEAEAILQQFGLALGTSVRMRSAAVPPGTIVQQDPAPGTLAAPGRAIDVTLARSP